MKINIKIILCLFCTLSISFNSIALSRIEAQEYYEQMTPYAICATIANLNGDNKLHKKLTDHMFDFLYTTTKGEYLSNTKRGFMVGYVSGMSQVVFSQVYMLEGEPRGMNQIEFAKFVKNKMCNKYM